MDEASRLEQLIAPIADTFHACGIVGLYLFGSRLKGSYQDQSDVDLFFDFKPNHKLSLFDVMDLEQKLEGIFKVKVDLMSRSSLHPMIASEVQATAVRIL
jgi:uncharacterized protein